MAIYDLLPKFGYIEPNNLKGLQPGFVVAQMPVAESERAEFETLKREKKVTLLDSYKEYLTDEEYADFTSRIDTFEVDTLEVELLKKYKSHTERTPQKTMRAFALFAPKTESAIDGLDAFVRKNLSR